MRMLSLGNVAGLILIGIYLFYAAGHQEIVWKGISLVRQKAMEGLFVDWGCPSSNRSACSKYAPEKY